MKYQHRERGDIPVVARGIWALERGVVCNPFSPVASATGSPPLHPLPPPPSSSSTSAEAVNTGSPLHSTWLSESIRQLREEKCPRIWFSSPLIVFFLGSIDCALPMFCFYCPKQAAWLNMGQWMWMHCWIIWWINTLSSMWKGRKRLC